MPRTTEQPENEATKQACVKSRLGRQIGQGRISQTGGKKICGKRYPGENIAAQPGPIVTAQPTEGGNQTSGGTMRSSRQSAVPLNSGFNGRDVSGDERCNLWPMRELPPEDHYAPGVRPKP